MLTWSVMANGTRPGTEPAERSGQRPCLGYGAHGGGRTAGAVHHRPRHASFGAPAPTLKIATNTPLAEKKKGWIDFNAGTIADGSQSIGEAGAALYALVLDVASRETDPHRAERIPRDLYF